MSSSRLRARYDMDVVHERILHDAEDRERLPETDFSDISRLASKAYRDAMREGKGLEDAERRALSALEASAPDSAIMFERATRDLGNAERGASNNPRQEFAFDFLFAWAVPAFGAAVVAILALSDKFVLAIGAFVIFIVALATAGLISYFWVGKLLRGTKPNSWSAVLLHSGGSIVGGLFVLVCFVYFAQNDWNRTREQELSVRLEKLNQAAAVTLAAIQAGASVKETQDAVRRSIAADWITVNSVLRTEGAVLGRAVLPQTQTAELRLTSLSEGSPRLASFLNSKSGESVPYADYIAGRVVKASLDNVTLMVGPDNTEQVFILPPGTLPPPVNSEVVAAITRSDNRAIFLQPIDSVVLDLKR